MCIRHAFNRFKRNKDDKIWRLHFWMWCDIQPRQTCRKLYNNDLTFDSWIGPSVSVLALTLIGAATRGGGTSGWYSNRLGQPPACISVQATECSCKNVHIVSAFTTIFIAALLKGKQPFCSRKYKCYNDHLIPVPWLYFVAVFVTCIMDCL